MLLATTGARAASGAWSRLAALHGAPVIIAGWIAFGVLVYLIGMVVSVGCYWIQMMLDGEPDDQIMPIRFSPTRACFQQVTACRQKNDAIRLTPTTDALY